MKSKHQRLFFPTLRAVFAAWLMVAALAGAAAAGPFEDAKSAYEHGDYAIAVGLWRPLADEGDTRAQYNLGLMYANGQGVPQDAAEAVTWYRKAAAAQGDAFAQLFLGFMYENGLGVPQDDAAAMTWYRKAADQDYAAAQYLLGVMYDIGQGVPQDDAAAAMWYRKAADQGEAKAQAILGIMCENGRGVPQDYVEAHKWYNLAAARFPRSDSESSAKAIKNRDSVAQKMSPGQIAEAEKLAREWKSK